MKKAIITDKGNIIFVEGAMAQSTGLTITGEENVQEVNLSNLSHKEYEKLKKQKKPKIKVHK